MAKPIPWVCTVCYGSTNSGCEVKDPEDNRTLNKPVDCPYDKDDVRELRDECNKILDLKIDKDKFK